MNILGINAYHGNASAAILCDGQLVAAVEEERFNRVKYAAGFPAGGDSILSEDGGNNPGGSRSRRGAAKSVRAAGHETFLRDAHAVLRARTRQSAGEIHGNSAKRWLRPSTSIPKSIPAQFHRVEHHMAHLASTFFCSPFEEAALLSADGLGDFASSMWGVGFGRRMNIHGSIAFPHSLGLYLQRGDAVSGLSEIWRRIQSDGPWQPTAQPEFLKEFRDIVQSNGSGFRLGLEYFTHHRTGPEMTWADADKTPVLGKMYSDVMAEKLGPVRDPAAPIEQRHKNLACSLQERLEEVYLGMLRQLHEETGIKSVCLAGGVAFNCVANGKILANTGFENVYVHPAAGDAGLAVGAAQFVWHQVLGNPREFVMEHAYWGPEFSRDEVRLAVQAAKFSERGCAVSELPEEELLRQTAAIIANGNILGWYQGRAEWGPRALGNRSIVADPRRPEMKEILNRRIKHREMFRPFAPSILAEKTGEWFEQSHPSPFMTMAYAVRKEMRDKIPAPTHVDGTGRLQTVTPTANPRYWKLIRAFEAQTGVPVVLNTSFNDNEPIVCKPQEAIDCFNRTQMDALVLGDFLIQRT